MSFIWLGILNALDGYFTYLGLAQGRIEEMNPWMAWLWSHSPAGFIQSKLALSLLLILLAFFLKKKQKKRMAFLLVPACMVYGGVMVIHLQWLL